MTSLTQVNRPRRTGLFAAVLSSASAIVIAIANQTVPAAPWAGEAGKSSQAKDASAQQQAKTVLAPAGASADQNRADLAEGQALFRGLCTGCHGGTGRGGKGPDLTDNRWIHGSTDADITRVIKNGVPGTTMKKLGDALREEQIRKLIAYIRSLARAGREHLEALHGRRSAGRSQTLLRSPRQGSVCEVPQHRRRGGPHRAGARSYRQPRAGEFLVESILQPSQDIAPEYEAVIVATKDGRVLTGLRVNETNFSIQLREENGRFHSFLKRDLDEVKVLKKSLMPENFAELLTVKEFHDLVAYLLTLE